MFTKTQSRKILTYVKEHSPKEFAPLIIERSKTALKTLYRMEKNGDRENDIDLGCPHCQCRINSELLKSCNRCLWTKAAKIISQNKNTEACTHIQFNGTTWADARKHGLIFYPDNVIINIHPASDLELVINFLKSHIDWGQERGWGRKLKNATHSKQKTI